MDKTGNRPNRVYKDSLFVDYFSKDRDWKEHFLSLYNALHGTSLRVEDTSLERVNIEQVLYKRYYNDIAVLVDGRFILMIEHQSTINPNMPLRLLEYVTRIYGNMVDSRAKFSDRLVPLAKPEFIVFYTGNGDIPPESCLHLSDAFPQEAARSHTTDSDPTLELKVKVCRIKGEDASPVVRRCPDLEQYVRFVGLVERAIGAGRRNPLSWAVHRAVRQGLLRDYLERKGGEVLSILMTEYNYATDIAVKQEEAYEQGIAQGAYQSKLETARSMLAYGDSPEKVARCTNLPLETVEGLHERISPGGWSGQAPE